MPTTVAGLRQSAGSKEPPEVPPKDRKTHSKQDDAKQEDVKQEDAKPRRYYVKPTGDESLASARTARLDLDAQVGRTQLIPAGAGIGRRGRGAGFYCAACDITLKDTKQYLEHLNKPSHLLNTGHTAHVARATAEDVRARVDACVARIAERERDRQTGLDTRLAVQEDLIKKEAEERREKRRKEKAEAKDAKKKVKLEKSDYGEDVRIEGEHDEDDMMVAMGFTAFGAATK